MYEIFIEHNAEKDLNKLNPPVFDQITSAILNLSEDPRPNGCRKLKGL
jgi:mRNA interferase RelE/StbE